MSTPQASVRAMWCHRRARGGTKIWEVALKCDCFWCWSGVAAKPFLRQIRQRTCSNEDPIGNNRICRHQDPFSHESRQGVHRNTMYTSNVQHVPPCYHPNKSCTACTSLLSPEQIMYSVHLPAINKTNNVQRAPPCY